MTDRPAQGSLFSDNEESDLFFFERRLAIEGFRSIAGIDEAGRGPLAGPVVAAAVILPPGVDLPGVNDSKKLSPAKRESLFDLINEKALSIGTGSSDAGEIDRLNILKATLLAMRRAVEALGVSPDYLLIDGINTIDSPLPQSAVKKGDSRSLSIAAASIIAKVTRDRLMAQFHERYPAYGFDSHKGYGAASHMDAIKRHGPSPIHRTTFAGVREYVR